MSDKKLKFKIATPEQIVFEEEIDQVTCMTEIGEITVLPGHIPLVASLRAGEMKIVISGSENHIAVAGGFVEIRPGDEVVVLADAAEHPEEIDVARAEEARERAKRLMQEKTLDAEEYASTQAALEKALTRIKVASRKKYKDVGKKIA